ncbi:MAG: type II toxin-antitoxin system RelE/ParE family toxin [Novosphingobium sp.]
MKYSISDQAWRDLQGIGRYIAQDNPARAVTFVSELTAQFRVIAERPKSFPARDELRPGLRSALHRPYVILFFIENDLVRIARVFHGARDIPQLI